ncbi:MAG: SsrA-binding protein SmpB [Candidatus Delongbacteria bacterium]|nr:SsrA-binding protein SmpB [Candidatus Delongbacteria bacterium]MBN2835927.1 SsrA-binding protein SmpB [Candidatus Delongbacteria bacterium]
MVKKVKDTNTSLAKNKKAFFDYEIIDKYEAGMVLLGSEVKSMKLGKVSIKEAYCKFVGNELFVIGMFVSEYKGASVFTHVTTRERKLLLHKQELKRLKQKSENTGMTVVPLEVYKAKHLIKIRIALAKGKREYEKRDTIRDRDAEREIQRAMKKSIY